MNLEKELFTILSNTNIKVYPGVATQNAKLPFIIYNVTSDTRINGLVGKSTAKNIRFQVDVYTKTTDERYDISESIENELGLSILNYFVYNTNNSNVENEYRKTIDLKVWSNN